MACKPCEERRRKLREWWSRVTEPRTPGVYTPRTTTGAIKPPPRKP